MCGREYKEGCVEVLTLQGSPLMGKRHVRTASEVTPAMAAELLQGVSAEPSPIEQQQRAADGRPRVGFGQGVCPQLPQEGVEEGNGEGAVAGASKQEGRQELKDQQQQSRGLGLRLFRPPAHRRSKSSLPLALLEEDVILSCAPSPFSASPRRPATLTKEDTPP